MTAKKAAPVPVGAPLTKEHRLEYYQVKFKDRGEWVYGEVSQFGDDAERYAKQGCLLIAEMITGKQYARYPESVTVIPLSPFPNEYYEKQGLLLQEAMKRSDATEGLVGKLFSIGVADGKAWYEVTAAGKRFATVEWRGYGGDNYTDQILGWGGQFPIEVIANQVRRFDTLAALFSSPKAKTAAKKAKKKKKRKKAKVKP